LQFFIRDAEKIKSGKNLLRTGGDFFALKLIYLSLRKRIMFLCRGTGFSGKFLHFTIKKERNLLVLQTRKDQNKSPRARIKNPFLLIAFLIKKKLERKN